MSLDGWVSATLQELTTKIGSGATPKGGKKAYKSEGISLVRSLNVHDRWFKIKNLAFIDDAQAALLDNVILEEDDVLLNITGASIARCCVLPSRHLPARVNQHVSIVRADQSAILPAFLCYLLTAKEYKDRLLSTGEKQGATRQALTKTLIQNFRVTFPQDLAAQKRIVSILDEAFSAIAKAKENAEKNLANARELFESYLNRVFTQQGPGWQEKTVEEVSTVINGYAFKSKDFDRSNPIKSIKITNVGVGEFVEDTSSKLPASFAKEFAKVAIPVGSIVLALTRTIIADGLKVAIVPADFNYALLNQRVAALAPKPELMTTGFLYHYFWTNIVADYVREKANTLMQPNLSVTDLRALPISVPSSTTEQAKIESRLRGMYAESKRLETIYTQKLANLDELKQSLLQKAFTGQLTAHDTATTDLGAV